jgi:hypothetical protein
MNLIDFYIKMLPLTSDFKYDIYIWRDSQIFSPMHTLYISSVR